MHELNKSPGRFPPDTKVLVGIHQGRWALIVEAPLRDERALPLRSATYGRLAEVAHVLYRLDPDEPLCALPHSLIVSLCEEANISPATKTKAGYGAEPVSRPEFDACLCGWDQSRHTFWLWLFEHRGDAQPSYRFPDSSFGEEPTSELARFLSLMHVAARLDDSTVAALARDQQGGTW